MKAFRGRTRFSSGKVDIGPGRNRNAKFCKPSTGYCGRSGLGRYRPVTAGAGFSTWQPAILDRTPGSARSRHWVRPDERVRLKKIPFPVADWRVDPHWPIKSFFNYVCEQRSLISALDAITQRCGYAYNDEYCFFPDLTDPDPSLHFDGVAFGVSDEEVVIAEVECWQYVRHVSLFWTEQNRDDADTVRQILLRIPG